MHGLPKIVLERLKREGIGNQLSRQSTIDNRQSAMGDRQSAIENRQFLRGFEHPDANLLAAFVEKTLTERERTNVLSHLAQCAECRELAALSLPGEVEVAQPVSSTAKRQWSAWPTLRWGALAAALGAAAIVIVLHSYPWRRQETVSKDIRPNRVASAGQAEHQSPSEFAAQPSPEAALAKAGPEPRGSSHETAKLEKGAGQRGNQRITAQPAGAETKQRVTLMAAARPPVAVEAEIGAESQTGATAAPAKIESAAASQDLTAAQAGGISVPSGTPSAPRAAASIRVASRLAEPSRMAFAGNLNRAVAPLAALWSISTSGKAQRSQDGGRTWEEVRVDDAVTFRAVLAMGRDVWAGGSALYHSSDGGATWKRVYLSSGESPTTETIVGITSGSRDLQHITVRTESGEQWTTEDGGQRWQKEP